MRGLAGEIRKSMKEGECQIWKAEPLPDNLQAYAQGNGV